MYYIASRAKHHSVQYLPVFFNHPPYEGNVIRFFREKFFSKNIFSFNFTFMIIEQLYILNVLTLHALQLLLETVVSKSNLISNLKHMS